MNGWPLEYGNEIIRDEWWVTGIRNGEMSDKYGGV